MNSVLCFVASQSFRCLRNQATQRDVPRESQQTSEFLRDEPQQVFCLLAYQQEFYKSALQQGRNSKIKGYMLTETADKTRLVTNFVRDLKVDKSQAQSQAAEAFYQHLFAGHPYGKIFADAAKVEALTLADCQQFVQNHLVASRSHLFISGQFDEATAEKAV